MEIIVVCSLDWGWIPFTNKLQSAWIWQKIQQHKQTLPDVKPETLQFVCTAGSKGMSLVCKGQKKLHWDTWEWVVYSGLVTISRTQKQNCWAMLEWKKCTSDHGIVPLMYWQIVCPQGKNWEEQGKATFDFNLIYKYVGIHKTSDLDLCRGKLSISGTKFKDF